MPSDWILREAVHLAIRADASATSTSVSPTSASSTAQPTDSGSSNRNDDNGSGGGSSPLLFFVALGFGVVFTNLWIIVGVKYCFRYNARNRARMMNEDGEPVALENMQRPHRRRREKKLMTMDEVNEKFPMMKYKTWVSARARDGLPTAGGVSVPPSRASSLRDAVGIIPETQAESRASSERVETTVLGGSTSAGVRSSGDGTAENEKPKDTTDSPTQAGQTPETKRPAELTRVTSGDDEEQINPALPPELLAAPGDACAICIDTLEDDEDVRGLTCGHAFHAVCVDPWLTSRRACCPLCKADYYTPKPRPNAEGEGNRSNNSPPDARALGQRNRPATFGTDWVRGMTSTRLTPAFLRRGDAQRSETQNQSPTQAGPSANTREAGRSEIIGSSPNTNIISSVRRAFRRGENPPQQQPTQPIPNETTASHEGVTPSQLEAGTRPTAGTTT